jgi:hypothetical protein
MVKDTRTAAKKAQQEHWMRKGQIAYINGLLLNILRNHKTIPPDINQYLKAAKTNIEYAFRAESRNNEFLNLNLKPTWKKK